MQRDTAYTTLPEPRRAKKSRFDLSRHVARFLCFVFALIGLLPLATVLIVRSTWASNWAVEESGRLLASQGIKATYRVALNLWPVSVELDDVRVKSTDKGPPAVDAPRVRVRPRFFALLSGKLAIDQVEIDQPKIRLAIEGGKLRNLDIHLESGDPKKPFKAPFNVFAVTDAELDIDVDGAHVYAKEIDVDITAEDNASHDASALEISLHAGKAQLHSSRLYGKADKPKLAVDDDTLCGLEGRVRYEGKAITVRHFRAQGSADLDVNEGTAPQCDLPDNDKRKVEIEANHLHVLLNDDPAKPPSVDGHVRVRFPIGLVERAVQLPETDGWMAIDVEGRYAEDTLIPDLSGHIEAHDIRLDQFNFAHEIESDILVRRNVVTSPVTKIWIGDGLAVLTDTVIEPLSKGIVLKRTRLDVTNVNFTSLLRDLGVHKTPHVAWDLREIHWPLLSGTFNPLHIDGDFFGKTYAFGVYDRPATDPARGRIVGFAEADLTAHVAVRPDALKFVNVHAKVGNSEVSGGSVSLGFHNDLRIDVEKADIDLEDISPIGPVPMKGRVVAKVAVGGKLGNPLPEGEISSAKDLKIADVSFGDLTHAKFAVDVHKLVIDLTEVRAKKGNSEYEVPTAKLDLGGHKGFRVDALARTSGFDFRDFLSMFNMSEDPRMQGIEARISTQAARVHVALGGPEDRCGGGFIEVHAKAHATDVALYGEKFDTGDADFDMSWYDRQEGLAGADIDVHSFVLAKTNANGAAVGTVLGSAVVRRGGALSANVVVDNVPVSRITSIGKVAGMVEGQVSAVAQVHGHLDEFDHEPGFTVQSEIDFTPLRVRGVAVGQSQVRVQMTQVGPRANPAGARRTGCGAPIPPPFDKDKYARDESAHGAFTLDGELFGKQIVLKNVTMTREKNAHVKGVVELRGLDLGNVARIASPPQKANDDDPGALADLGGETWADIFIDDLPLADLAHARASLQLAPTVVRKGQNSITLVPPPQRIIVANDALTLPANGLELNLQTPNGFSGGLKVVGGVQNLTRGAGASMKFNATLDTIKLADVAQFVPKVERAVGTAQGEVVVSGTFGSPEIAGTVHVRADEIIVHGAAGAMTEVKLDAFANTREVTATGSAKFAGGIVQVRGYAPISGASVGFVDGVVQARGVHFTPSEGISATADADLRITLDPHATGGALAQLPHVSGDVLITSFDYTRPVNLTTDLSGRARRTNVETYDPTLDAITFDVYVRSSTPLKIKNNLVEVQLGIDAGALLVTGTNQRIGLRGDLHTLPGGRFHFRASDFDIRQGLIRFDDPTRIAPSVDVTAVTEYRRYLDSNTSSGASAASTYTASGGAGISRTGAIWRITLHAYGDADNLRIELTSDPNLSQEDIVLLLTVGMTRAEIDQLQASSLGASIALNYLGAASGADRAVKEAIPVIDDFRFGSATTRSGKTDPQLTIGKRLTDNVRASVTTGFSEDRELRSNISWRLNQRLSVEGSYDNVNDVASSSIGNLGVNLRWRLEFE